MFNLSGLSHPHSSRALIIASVAGPFSVLEFFVARYCSRAAFTLSFSATLSKFSAESITRFLNALCANSIPNPYSALSSNKELAQAGPLPFLSTVYGDAGEEPPQIEEHPVAFAMYILLPNN